jgi:hypothetical protein
MLKLKKAYSAIIKVPVQSLRLLYQGTRVDDRDTPVSLKMEQNDVMDAYRERPLIQYSYTKED